MSAAVRELAADAQTEPTAAPRLTRSGAGFVFAFDAMATPCEVRLETDDAAIAKAAAMQRNVKRVASNKNSAVIASTASSGKINASNGAEVRVDDETAQLLTFAAHCFDVSGGRFDVTSGVCKNLEVRRIGPNSG